jgi:hypothetical protein
VIRHWPSAAALFAAAATCALPAAAQQTVSTVDPLGAGPVLLSLPPHPTDAGKPVIYDPQFVAKGDNDSGCAPSLPCRLQLLGVIQNNGAVELRAKAFTW